jgi:hypothetical protein
MSAVYSIAYSSSVQILTDGASYTPQGIYMGAVDKVSVARHVPMAVTGRGPSFLIAMLGQLLCAAADAGKTFDRAAELAGDLLASCAGKATENGVKFELLIAGVSETAGPCHALWQTHGAYDGVPANVLHWLPAECGLGPMPSNLELVATGITPETFAAAGEEAMRIYGADFMEVLRRKAGTNFTDDDQFLHFGIGGHCDLTIISANGIEQHRLRTWDDDVGRLIDPFRNDPIEQVAA